MGERAGLVGLYVVFERGAKIAKRGKKMFLEEWVGGRCQSNFLQKIPSEKDLYLAVKKLYLQKVLIVYLEPDSDRHDRSGYPKAHEPLLGMSIAIKVG